MMKKVEELRKKLERAEAIETLYERVIGDTLGRKVRIHGKGHTGIYHIFANCQKGI
jgi:hypothetical protein